MWRTSTSASRRSDKVEKYTNTKVAPEQKRGRVQAKSTDTASASGSAKAKQAEPTSAITSIRDYIKG